MPKRILKPITYLYRLFILSNSLLLIVLLSSCEKPTIIKHGLYHNNKFISNGTVEDFIKYKGHAELYGICGENKACLVK